MWEREQVEEVLIFDVPFDSSVLDDDGDGPMVIAGANEPFVMINVDSPSFRCLFDNCLLMSVESFYLWRYVDGLFVQLIQTQLDFA